MARRTEDFKVTEVGRDQGKTFRLTEMSAFHAERWAAKALLALMKSGVEVPEDVASAGLSGLAAIAMKAFGNLEPEALLPLLDEMLLCVQCIPDPRNPLPRALVEEDIEEMKTLLAIRKKLIDLHLGFSLAAKLSSYSASAAATNPTSPDTSTSLQSSE